MDTKRSVRRRRGFTLTEIMIVVLLMGMAIAIFSASFPAAGQSLYRSRHTDIASDACQQQLDFWRNVGYGSVPAFANGASKVKQSFTTPSELPGGSASITFVRVNSDYGETTADTGRLRVDATVSWAGSGNDRGAVTQTTLLLQ